MAPVRPRKRKSESSPSTSSPQRSPIKKRKMGITLAQKQALIDNLQLEITERARRLRAQYNIQAQQLRSRVEMRVNRIPTTLRKVKMGELLTRCLQPQQSRAPRSQYVARPPPVPAKDGTSPKPIPRKPVPTSSSARPQKRLSSQMSGADKENQGEAIDISKKRLRGVPTDMAPVAASQVLSPASSNTRIVPRERPASPSKSMISRPASPIKGPAAKASSNIISNMVERAKATRPAATTRKLTTSSTASSNAGTTATTATGRLRKAPAPPPSTTVTRGRRKVSVTSESSEGSTTTVVKKTTTASRATKTAPTARRTVMNTIKSATAKKAPTTKPAPAPAATGRTLRKRA
ncbi:Borealin N terminal-domain-containing protein [Xylariaceae sp. FL1651]|nr:Borealin N terminal-domain-containing protein [Xylariaceae sp. FL1651]